MPWMVEKELLADWFESLVLACPLGGPRLARHLGRLCLSLESRGGGRSVSNLGGWQSGDLTAHPDRALQKLMSLMHRPLATFLRKQLGTHLPRGLALAHGVSVAAVAEQLWANVNRAGHSNTCHDHGIPTQSVLASGIYYPSLKDTDDAWGTCTSEAMVRFFPRDTDPVEVVPQAGLLLLFPTDLPHEVEPVPPEGGPRASLAFNLRVRWLDRGLLRAAIAGSTDNICKLIEAGADVEEVDGALGLSAMHLAAEAGHRAAVETLSELGAQPSPISVEGWLPLTLAAERGHVPVVQYLLSQGAGAPRRSKLADQGTLVDPQLERQLRQSPMERALAVATKQGHAPVIAILTEAEAAPSGT